MKKSQFTIEKKPGYLEFTLTGDYDKKEFLEYPKMVVAACEREGINKVLINALDLSGTDMPTMDRFFMGQSVAATIGPRIKLAVVWPEDHINKFMETVAVNRGGWINVLGDRESAQKWLLGNY